MADENVKGNMRVKVKHLESGNFREGLRFYADKSNNYHVRLGMAKVIRQIEKRTEEPFKQYQDLLREFGTRDARGRVVVLPSSMTIERAAQWDEQIRKWQEIEIELESDLFTADGILVMNLPKEVLDQIPGAFLEEMLDYIELKEKGETKDEKIARLEAELAEAKKATGKAEKLTE